MNKILPQISNLKKLFFERSKVNLDYNPYMIQYFLFFVF